MQLFCPSCQATYAGESHCPKCRGRLLAPQETFVISGPPRQPPPPPDPPTFTARTAVGAVVGVGVYLGLRDVAGAIESGVPDGLLRGLAAVIGGLFAGAGRREGATTGFAAGGITAGLPVGIVLHAAGELPADWLTLFAGVLAAAAAGAAAGFAGGRVWPAETPLPQVDKAGHGSSSADSPGLALKKKQPRPTAWGQIAVAAVFAVAGILMTDDIRYALYKGSAGMMHVNGPRQGPYVGFQLCVGILAVAGVIAGAGTKTGGRNGLVVGVTAAAAVWLASYLKPDVAIPAVEGFYLTFSEAPQAVTTRDGATRVFGGILALAVVGGWVGGALLPPLAARRRRTGRREAQS